MNICSSYLDKHAENYAFSIGKWIDGTELAIVIPCYDEKEITKTIFSLISCNRPPCAVTVIVVINSSVNDTEEVLQTNNISSHEIKLFSEKHSDLQFAICAITANHLSIKFAGVGLARKIGMDAAVRGFYSSKIDGVIVSLDADTTCEPNYLEEIYNHFKNNKSNGASIYFEHPVSDKYYSEDIRNAATRYELFLRYYVQGLIFAGFPFAFHTVGSSMAVKSSSYCKQGGMNKRKAGEDFYFINKIILLGNYSVINSTTVYPSPRKSNRVHFGTGKTVGDIIMNKGIFLVDNPICFEGLRLMNNSLKNIYNNDFSDVPTSVLEFTRNEFELKIREIKNNSIGFDSFKNRFWQWFNSFKVMKYLHYRTQNGLEKVKIENAAERLLRMKDFNYEDIRAMNLPSFISILSLLEYYRNIDKQT